jgi:phosphodiesterase/alkaline phosphatase D-like protein
MADISTTHQSETKLVLGPFVGDITDQSVKLWVCLGPSEIDKKVYVTLTRIEVGPQSESEARLNPNKTTAVHEIVPTTGVITCVAKDFGVGTVTIENLEQNSRYSYALWLDEKCDKALDLNGSVGRDASSKEDLLQPDDLYFWTLPTDGFWRQLDFLLMSCHNPDTKKTDGHNGFAVWHQIQSIIKQNANVRFAILAGDQIYADDVEARVLKEDKPEKRREHYFKIYKEFWNDVNYRRVLCRMPAFLMWDDHDITDGWGSREDSFEAKDSGEFKASWRALLGTAKEMFALMQASRNPAQLAPESGFDTCFRVGKAGFVLADLRSSRNIRHASEYVNGEKTWVGRIWKPEQLEAIKKWIDRERNNLDTLFFVSTVVFSHGAPSIEQFILKIWFHVIDFVNLADRLRFFKKQLALFNSKVGDLRDDINDSWGSDANRKEAGRVLDFLFDLENPAEAPNSTPQAPVFEKEPLNVIILSGDIHTPGYSTIYSADEKHERKAAIPHIVATPVAYEPFSWVGEAIFRHLTKVVDLGDRKRKVTRPDGLEVEASVYTSQVSHHFCYRNVVVVSLRNYARDESHVKVKYYLEGFPEPQVMLFDLNHGARREGIAWPIASKTTSIWQKLFFWRKAAQPTASLPQANTPPTTPLDLPDIRPQ